MSKVYAVERFNVIAVYAKREDAVNHCHTWAIEKMDAGDPSISAELTGDGASVTKRGTDFQSTDYIHVRGYEVRGTE
jgi:hypothetical protein